MEFNTFKFKLYKSLLEENLTNEQREVLQEGIIDALKDFFGAGKDTAQEIGSNFSKIFNNHKYSRRVLSATKNIRKEINDLKKVAKDAGVEESAVDEMMERILNKSGIQVELPQPDNSREAATQPPEGTLDVLSSDIIKAEPEKVASVAAELVGKDAGKIADQIKKEKPDVISVAKVLAVAIAEKSGVSKQSAFAVVKALISDGHFTLTEAKRRRHGLVLENVRHIVEEIESSMSYDKTLSTWNKLAFINESVYSSGGIKMTLKKALVDIKLRNMQPDDLLAAMRQLSPKERYEEFQDKEKQIYNAFQSEGKLKHLDFGQWKNYWLKDFLGSKPTEKQEKKQEPVTIVDPPASAKKAPEKKEPEKASPKEAEKAPEKRQPKPTQISPQKNGNVDPNGKTQAPKQNAGNVKVEKYKKVFDSIKDKVKNVSEEDAYKVIKTLDDLRSVEISLKTEYHSLNE